MEHHEFGAYLESLKKLTPKEKQGLLTKCTHPPRDYNITTEFNFGGIERIGTSALKLDTEMQIIYWFDFTPFFRLDMEGLGEFLRRGKFGTLAHCYSIIDFKKEFQDEIGNSRFLWQNQSSLRQKHLFEGFGINPKENQLFNEVYEKSLEYGKRCGFEFIE